MGSLTHVSVSEDVAVRPFFIMFYGSRGFPSRGLSNFARSIQPLGDRLLPLGLPWK